MDLLFPPHKDIQMVIPQASMYNFRNPILTQLHHLKLCKYRQLVLPKLHAIGISLISINGLVANISKWMR